MTTALWAAVTARSIPMVRMLNLPSFRFGVSPRGKAVRDQRALDQKALLIPSLPLIRDLAPWRSPMFQIGSPGWKDDNLLQEAAIAPQP